MKKKERVSMTPCGACGGLTYTKPGFSGLSWHIGTASWLARSGPQSGCLLQRLTFLGWPRTYRAGSVLSGSLQSKQLRAFTSKDEFPKSSGAKVPPIPSVLSRKLARRRVKSVRFQTDPLPDRWQRVIGGSDHRASARAGHRDGSG